MRRARVVLACVVLLLLTAVGAAAPSFGALPGGGAAIAGRVDPGLEARLLAGEGPFDVIVQFATPPTDADARAMLAAGFLPGLTRYTVVPAVYGTAPAAAIRRMAAHPRVTYIEHDDVLTYFMDRSTTVTRSKQLWDAQYTVGGEVHNQGITGRDVGIAIVDSGVDARHPDLLWKPAADITGDPAKTMLNLKMTGRSSAVDWGNEVPDLLGDGSAVGVDTANTDIGGGHGTHVAGIAAGNGRNGNGRFTGTAPGANIIGFGAGDTLVIHAGLAAFDWIHQHHAEHNIRVINNSWGGAGEWRPELVLTKAIQRLSNEDGIVMVFAAGNSGGDGSDLQSSVWGNIPEVIQVANYYDREGWLDSTSSRGLRTDENTWPDLAAPGSQIISAAAVAGPVTYYGSAQDAVIAEIFEYDEPYVVPVQTPAPMEQQVGDREVIAGDYASLSGTSMAAPAVAGVVALVLEANPALTPAQIRTLLRDTANQPPNRTYENDGYAIGKGVVDAAEAVAVALKMRDGLSYSNALAQASLDLTSSPAKVNAGPGPVTDNTVPLLPSSPPPVTGNPQIFHGGLIDPAVLTKTYVVAPGEPVALVVRSLTSNDPAVTLKPDSYTASIVVRRASDGAIAYGPFPATIGSDSFGTRLEYEWTVPPEAPIGKYLFDSSITVTATGVSYPVSSLPFSIGAPT